MKLKLSAWSTSKFSLLKKGKNKDICWVWVTVSQKPWIYIQESFIVACTRFHKICYLHYSRNESLCFILVYCKRAFMSYDNLEKNTYWEINGCDKYIFWTVWIDLCMFLAFVDLSVHKAHQGKWNIWHKLRPHKTLVGVLHQNTGSLWPSFRILLVKIQFPIVTNIKDKCHNSLMIQDLCFCQRCIMVTFHGIIWILYFFFFFNFFVALLTTKLIT